MVGDSVVRWLHERLSFDPLQRQPGCRALPEEGDDVWHAESSAMVDLGLFLEPVVQLLNTHPVLWEAVIRHVARTAGRGFIRERLEYPWQALVSLAPHWLAGWLVLGALEADGSFLDPRYARPRMRQHWGRNGAIGAQSRYARSHSQRTGKGRATAGGVANRRLTARHPPLAGSAAVAGALARAATPSSPRGRAGRGRDPRWGRSSPAD